MKYEIKTMKNYPEDGKHQEVVWDLPFEIRRGEDGYWYTVDGKERTYNMGKTTTSKWIVNLKSNASDSLKKIFKIRTALEYEKLIEYCIPLYKQSLQMEIVRLNKEFNSLGHPLLTNNK